MTATDPDPMDHRIVGCAPGDGVELAWQACVHASPPRPGVRPPPSCRLVDPPGPDIKPGVWSQMWARRLDFGEAVGWPSHLVDGVQWYAFVGIMIPADT